MSEKLLFGLTTAALIAPLCAVCVLGPAVLGSLLAGAFGWLGGLSPGVTVGGAIIAATLIYRLVRRSKRRTDQRGEAAPGEPAEISGRVENEPDGPRPSLQPPRFGRGGMP